MMLPEILTTSFWGQNVTSLWRAVKQMLNGELRLELVENQPDAANAAKISSPIHKSEVGVDISDVSLPPLPFEPLPARPGPRLPPGNDDKTLTVYCFGLFRLFLNDQPVDKWSSNKAKSIFKYLIANRDQPVPMEMLMDHFWPDVEQQYARRSLHQAIYTLRKTFQPDDDDLAIVLYEDGCYCLNPALTIWIDYETFSAYYKAGQRLEHAGQLTAAIGQYQVAVSLYEGDFLAEDRYEEWPHLQRERLKHNYLDLLDRLSQHYFDQGEPAMAITLCQKLLDADRCREDAHRRLMRSYLRLGQRHLALRQYHLCMQALQEELEVPPMPATTDLFHQIQNNPACGE